MRWLDLANVLFDRSNPLSPRGAHVHLDTAGWLRTWTPHQNQAADSAARFFAKHQDWSAMDPDVSCQMYFRCLFAIEQCIKYDAQGSLPPDCPENERQSLEFLLIEAWHQHGMAWAEQKYARRGAGSFGVQLGK
jgi:hypothetical protein